MIADGRQVAPTLAGIRDDHRIRYQWAAEQLSLFMNKTSVVDAGSGCGYGSYILARAGCLVVGIESSPMAVDYAREHYTHARISYIRDDITDARAWPPGIMDAYDAVVAFEVIEHLSRPELFLDKIDRRATLIGSVPNEDRYPFDPSNPQWHKRHYRPDQLRLLLKDTGWVLHGMWCQAGKRGTLAKVATGTHGRTMLFLATAR